MRHSTSSFTKKDTSSPPMFVPDNAYQQTICAGARIGKKGYTIPKALLAPDDLRFLQHDLLMVPVKQGPTYGVPDQDNQAFPVYRENTNKIYLPRFYGIKRYGFPHHVDAMKPPDCIDCPFPNSLRDYQNLIVDSYMSTIRPDQEGAQGGIIQVGCGKGKCLAYNTPILMYDGTVKLVQDVVEGNQLMGDDSTPREVLSLARGRETMYRVHETKGEGYTVNESHILSLRYGTYKGKLKPKSTVVDMSVTEYLNLPKSYHGRASPLRGYRVPVVFPEKEVDLDPYVLGYWLGDGDSNSTRISTQESRVIKYLVDCFKTKHPTLYLRYTGAQYDYRINSTQHTHNLMMRTLTRYDLIQNKHIPLDYKCNSRTVQLSLLAGLLDSDGYYSDNCYEIIQKNERLLDDIIYLARSLGFAAFKKMVRKTCTNAPGGPKTGTYYKTTIYGAGLEYIPVQCLRKRSVPRKQVKDALNYIIRLEKLSEDEYYGFEIDGNRRFVLGDFTVTHNTVMSIKLISLLSLKTLIIVHKEFLLNQWIERIAEFLPSASIGRIQGPVYDVAGKDIVIGMLQTLYDREFPEDAFDCFGLTVVDEVHRIGSRQFSKALLRIQTPYMLGVTATLERKDGLTKVIHHFIGPTVYQDHDGLQSEEGAVLVRAMEFVSRDPEFNEVVTDYRGNTQISTMISKLCSHGPRTKFLVDILRGLVAESPEAQILVLGHNRCLLVDLHNAIVGWNFATTGYYLGGMKSADLEASTEKQIILATYAMASEGFDHKNLSVLVFVTPKTDIVQSVGRIFRKKHERHLIVDVVDTHDSFKNQWTRRRAYYKQCGFKIHHCLSTDTTSWKVVYEPGKERAESKGCLISL